MLNSYTFVKNGDRPATASFPNQKWYSSCKWSPGRNGSTLWLPSAASVKGMARPNSLGTGHVAAAQIRSAPATAVAPYPNRLAFIFSLYAPRSSPTSPNRPALRSRVRFLFVEAVVGVLAIFGKQHWTSRQMRRIMGDY